MTVRQTNYKNYIYQKVILVWNWWFLKYARHSLKKVMISIIVALEWRSWCFSSEGEMYRTSVCFVTVALSFSITGYMDFCIGILYSKLALVHSALQCINWLQLSIVYLLRCRGSLKIRTEAIAWAFLSFQTNLHWVKWNQLYAKQQI